MKVDAYTKALLGAAIRHAKQKPPKNRDKASMKKRKKRKQQKASRKANR